MAPAPPINYGPSDSPRVHKKSRGKSAVSHMREIKGETPPHYGPFLAHHPQGKCQHIQARDVEDCEQCGMPLIAEIGCLGSNCWRSPTSTFYATCPRPLPTSPTKPRPSSTMFKAASETMLTIAADPKASRCQDRRHGGSAYPGARRRHIIPMCT